MDLLTTLDVLDAVLGEQRVVLEVGELAIVLGFVTVQVVHAAHTNRLPTSSVTVCFFASFAGLWHLECMPLSRLLIGLQLLVINLLLLLIIIILAERIYILFDNWWYVVILGWLSV